jgi:hypothetical protein
MAGALLSFFVLIVDADQLTERDFLRPLRPGCFALLDPTVGLYSPSPETDGVGLQSAPCRSTMASITYQQRQQQRKPTRVAAGVVFHIR